MSLTEQLQALRQDAEKAIPEEIKAMFQRASRELEEKQLAENAIKPGDAVEDFTLPNASGDRVSLKKLLETGPVVLSFYRGGWCPYCNLELRALQQYLPEIQALGAQLLAISPQIPDKSLSTVEKNTLEFEVLSDTGNEVARMLGLVFKVTDELKPVHKQWGADLDEFNGDDKYELPIPSTIIVNTDGIVIHAYHDIDYGRRMEPEEIIEVLKKIG